jgi:hypothetical protein
VRILLTVIADRACVQAIRKTLDWGKTGVGIRPVWNSGGTLQDRVQVIVAGTTDELYCRSRTGGRITSKGCERRR